MTTVDIFYQGHGIKEFEQIELRADHTVAAFKAMIVEKHGLTGELLVFIEEQETPLGEHIVISEVCIEPTAKLHVHHCREIAISVAFAGETAHHKFGPATTIGAIKNWAASKFGMTPAEAGEHMLQISGTQDRPAPGTHVGSLTKAPACSVAFDLVPDERVNGSPEVVG